MRSDQVDVAVVGAGAAGLMAAIWAARAARAAGRETAVVALEGAAKVGAKILISGGGRCNVTHDVVHPADFWGSRTTQVGKVLRSFGAEATVAFFAELGVELKREETGKLFPITDRAATVLDALLAAVTKAGARVRTGARVEEIERSDAGGFKLRGSWGETRAGAVVLATGGRSLPKTGSDGIGYELARRLGHSTTQTWPALVPLLLPEGHWALSISGIAVPVRLAVSTPAGKLLARREGAMLFTHFGVSGPVVLDISRHWLAARDAGLAPRLVANLAGDDDVEGWLRAAAADRPRATVGALVAERFPQRLAAALAELQAGVPANRPLGQLRREERQAVVAALSALELPVTGDRGWQFAEVTAGGVPLDEVHLATMESRRAPGLFLCGEILDVDGPIGGYNFQWAWSSGRLAGLGASRSLAAAPAYDPPP